MRDTETGEQFVVRHSELAIDCVYGAYFKDRL